MAFGDPDYGNNKRCVFKKILKAFSCCKNGKGPSDGEGPYIRERSESEEGIRKLEWLITYLQQKQGVKRLYRERWQRDRQGVLEKFWDWAGIQIELDRPKFFCDPCFQFVFLLLVVILSGFIIYFPIRA